MAEVGVEGAKEALKKQGFEAGAYEYLLQPLYEEAQARRLAAAAWTDDGECGRRLTNESAEGTI